MAQARWIVQWSYGRLARPVGRGRPALPQQSRIGAQAGSLVPSRHAMDLQAGECSEGKSARRRARRPESESSGGRAARPRRSARPARHRGTRGGCTFSFAPTVPSSRSAPDEWDEGRAGSPGSRRRAQRKSPDLRGRSSASTPESARLQPPKPRAAPASTSSLPTITCRAATACRRRSLSSILIRRDATIPANTFAARVWHSNSRRD